LPRNSIAASYKAMCLYDDVRGTNLCEDLSGAFPCAILKLMNSKQLPQVWETIHMAVIMNSHKEQEPDLPSFHPFQASFSSPGLTKIITYFKICSFEIKDK
jgi:hypothetical protein